MNYETAIELAHQRMREVGKKPGEYHIDVLSIVGTEAERRAFEITYKAYNEFLYLIDYARHYGLLILSDTAFFNANDYTYNTKLQEFTGEIKIFRIPRDNWSIDGTGEIDIPIPIGERVRMIPVDFLRVVIH